MKCPRCEGSGKCIECKGTGSVTCLQCQGKGTTTIELPSGVKKENKCPLCGGTGRTACSPACESCGGNGEITADYQKEQFKKYHPLALQLKEHATVVSFFILALNIVLYIASSVGGDGRGHNMLFYMGCLFGPSVERGEWWRVIAAIFLHVNLMHIIINSYCLFIICPPIERLIGPYKFLALYLLSGLAGNLLSLLLIPTIPSAGASGSLFGIMGAYFGLNLRHKIFHPSTMQQFLGWLVINLFIGFMPGLNINIWAHLGGLASGFLLSYFINLSSRS